MLERRRVRGNWNVPPLWEGKILLGVLKEQGLAGKGLVEAFEKWAPRIVGASRADMNKVYEEQTGHEMSDYILVQQADKAVRYKQLPPEAEGFRLALVQSMGSQSRERVATTMREGAVSAEQNGRILSARNRMALKIPRLMRAYTDLSGAPLAPALLSTNELAGLTGFAPKTIRRWAARRLLNFIRVGNQFRFRPAAVELFLRQREVRK
jgi:excisionase family DNA binding protein